MTIQTVKQQIRDHCQRNNIDPRLFVVGYGRMVHGNRILHNITNSKQFQQEISRYAVKYIESLDRYVVWELRTEKPYRTVLSVSLRDVEEAVKLGHTHVQKSIEFSGRGKEIVYVLDRMQFETFVQRIV